MMNMPVAAALALASAGFTVGYYEPTYTSEPSICPQFIRRTSATQISVVYVGDCGWQGPFTYSCTSSDSSSNAFGRCFSSDQQVTFEWTSERTYRWVNRAYAGYEADFEWVTPRPPETR